MSLFKNVNLVFYYVKDWEGAKSFYGEVLDWPVAYVSEEIGWLEYGRDNEAHLAIQRWPGPGPVPPREGGGTLVLTVDDAHKTVEELRRKGVKCDDATVIPGIVAFSTLYDPEGNRIQFASSTPPPA